MRGTLRVGDILDGRYRIDALIGEGGMGVVARATQLDLGRAVALKALRPEVLGNSQVVERFYREARAASRVRGPHALQILDVGRTSDGAPYMVMELLHGEDLDHLVRRKGALRLDVAVWLMIQACSGVADAHRVRVIHRDLKPSNLFLARREGGPILKVLDFGISRMSEEASALTRTMTQLGTPQYMSPEQIERPKAVDHRTDIWALGCIFHRLLTSQTAFKGQGVQLVSAVIKNQRKRPSELTAHLPPEVDAIVDRCLAPRPDDRFQTVDALTMALRALSLDDLSDSVPVITPLPEDEDSSSASDDSSHTTVDVAVEVEHTLALEQSHSGARLVTGNTPAPSVRSERTQVMPTSIGPMARSQFSRSNTLARSRTTSGLLGVGAAMALAFGTAVVALVVPRFVAENAKAEAARAGLSLAYAGAHMSWTGVTLTDASVTPATGSLESSGPALRAPRLLVPFSGALRTQSAELTLAHDDMTITASDVTCTIDFGAQDGNTAPRVHASSAHVDVRLLGVSLDDLQGSLDGTTESATFTATSAGTSDAALAIAGSYDAAGYRASLRVPRQPVTQDSVALAGFPARTASNAPEVSLVVDIQSDAGASVRGNAHLLVLGVAANARGVADLDAEVAFRSKAGAITVDSGKARLGPFTLTSSDTSVSFSGTQALALHLGMDTESVPCADLLRARADATPTLSGINVAGLFAMSGGAENKGNAHVGVTLEHRGHAPLTITLAYANVCNLHVFE